MKLGIAKMVGVDMKSAQTCEARIRVRVADYHPLVG